MTAPTISIHVDGDSAIALNATPVFVTRYNMSTAEVSQEAVAVNRDRNDLGIPSWQNVTESLELLITGASAAAVQAVIWSINSALDRARQSRRTWGGTRVWLEVQSAADSETWRSEILAGSLQVPAGLDDIGKTRIEATLVITRRAFWEGGLTALQMSTALTAETTSLVTLYNVDDSGGSTVRNYVNIGATRVTGELPTPLMLRIQNGETADQTWAQVFAANYVFMDAANVDPILLGSSVVGGAAQSWGGDGESPEWRILLSAAQLADFSGQYCRILGVFSSLTTGTWLRVRVDFSADGSTFSTLYHAPTQVRYTAGELIDIGCIPLPPFGYNTTSKFIYVTITGQLVGGFAGTLAHIQICPTGHGLFRRLDIGGDAINVSLEDDDALVDDGPEDTTYVEDATDGDTWPVVRPYFAPIMAWPGRINRLRILLRTNTAFPSGITLKARAWFRPRRLSI